MKLKFWLIKVQAIQLIVQWFNNTNYPADKTSFWESKKYKWNFSWQTQVKQLLKLWFGKKKKLLKNVQDLGLV